MCKQFIIEVVNEEDEAE
jgi:hypothetical protein